jgi:flagellar assembly factor FliW
MKIQSIRFGEMELQEEKIITFAHGLPGFKDNKLFIVVDLEESPFSYLQSVEEGDLAFIIVSPFDFYKQYEFDFPDNMVSELNILKDDVVKVYNIVSVRDELSEATMNLAAPIIINDRTKIGMQYILPDGTFSIRQPLFSQPTITGGV